MVTPFRIPALFLFAICLSSSPGFAQPNFTDTLGSTIVHNDIVVDTSHFELGYFSGPWDLHWGPDDQLWFTNKKTLEKYDPVSGNLTTLLTLTSGYIMGVATHPDFVDTPWVYLTIDTAQYYGAGNRINLVRYDYSAATQQLSNPQQMLYWTHGGEHSGGRMTFGDDGKLYVATAEYFIAADSLGSNSGKVLRVNADGSIPGDNFRTDYTWTIGHRNPQGIVKVPNGNIIVAEFGQIEDELNLIEKGNHYGWIIYDGITCITYPDTCATWLPQLTFPIDTGRNPHSGITWYDSPAIPEFNGLITAVTGLNQGLMVYPMNANYDDVTSQSYYLRNEFGRVRDVCASPDGKLYFIARDRFQPHIRVIYNPTFVSNDSPLSPGFTVYPNPGGNLLQIRSSENLSGEWRIQTLSGTEILHGTLTGMQTTISCENLPAGCYFIFAGKPGAPPLRWIKTN